MPILIYHGNGLTAISRAVSNIKTKFQPLMVSEFNGKVMSIEEALMSIATSGLFSDTRLIVLDNFPEKTDISSLNPDSATTVVFRFNKKVPLTSVFLKSANQIKAQIQEFSEADEVSIFPFLDLLGEKKSAAFGQFEKVYAEYGAQYILTMLYYFFRRMIALPKKNGSPYMQQKIDHQKKNFSLEKIGELYKLTLETDFKIKSGLIEEKLGLSLVVEKILSVGS